MNAFQWRRSARIAWLLLIGTRIVILIDNGPDVVTVPILAVAVVCGIASWLIPVKPIEVTISDKDGNRTRGTL
jgi:hypothetical protein